MCFSFFVLGSYFQTLCILREDRLTAFVFAVSKSYVVDGESRGHANGMGWKVENGKQ